MNDIQGAPFSSYSPEDQEFYQFWYGHMLDDLMQPPLANVDHATARYIWNAARASPAPAAPKEQQADRVAYLLANPDELCKFVEAAQKNADDFLALNRAYTELLSAAPEGVQDGDALGDGVIASPEAQGKHRGNELDSDRAAPAGYRGTSADLRHVTGDGEQPESSRVAGNCLRGSDELVVGDKPPSAEQPGGAEVHIALDAAAGAATDVARPHGVKEVPRG
jgi:hypothetical protein